jgi:hypothetical protein
MDETAGAPGRGDVETLLRRALKGQYSAVLAMLGEAVQRCPDDLWLSGQPTPFWQVAYHTAFFTHLYLQPDEASFCPWEQHREEYQFLGCLPWPPHRPPKISKPYRKTQVLDYVGQCEAMVDAAVEALDLASHETGFWWYKMSKIEHQIMNMRHIQHHASHLAARLRAATRGSAGVDWIGVLQRPGE